MKNVQISFDENLLEAVDSIAASSRLSRSAIVREALQRWIKEKKIKEFEDQWISKLKKDTDAAQDSESWMDIEQWGDE